MADDATASALSEMTPQPAPNPDAQTTVNDFLDYTEFFPSDLLRSLRLIGDLDSTYLDSTLRVHELSKTYGRLPDIPAGERPDPITLRREIAAALDKALSCRESSFAEAARLYEVAERHVRRLAIIKTKLQALPQPPSRDPTPAPVSPQASRSVNRYDRTPRLHLHFDGGRHGASSTARQRDRNRKSLARAHTPSSGSDDSDGDSVRSTIDLATRIKIHKDKTPKPPRARPPANRSLAGISTSNALAMLSPPPPDAKPGSKFAPWFKLTEYEMAVLRKHMKKNAMWTPSDTMIRRELEKKGRGHTFYEQEKARCEATGEEFLDEEPYKPSSARIPSPERPTPHTTTNANANANANENANANATPNPNPNPNPNDSVETLVTPIEPSQDSVRDDIATTNKGMKLNEAKEAKKSKRESQREQARRDAQELEDATRKIKEAAESLNQLNFASDAVNVTPSAGRRKSTAKPSNKRKREASPAATVESPTVATREASQASQDSGTRPPEPKRVRPTLQPIAPAPSNGQSGITSGRAVSTPLTSTSIVPSPLTSNSIPPTVESTKTTTVQVPLAPAAPGTPKAAEKPTLKVPSRRATPTLPSPSENKKSSPPTSVIPAATAASSRPRRESVAPSKAVSPPPTLTQPAKTQKTPTPGPEPVRSFPAPALSAHPRPRSSQRHVPTPKAQSEEPKPNDAGKPTRELRRHSIFSQSAVAAPTRASTRKKPPPKGDVTSAENGQKTVTNVKRAQGSKNKKRKKTDEDSTEPLEEIDPNEPRYCICDDVSYGQMISCDNAVSVLTLYSDMSNKLQCEKEWFHLECVGMTEKDIPSRRAKWFCPDCRQHLGITADGNPVVPPPLPGRRGNR